MKRKYIGALFIVAIVITMIGACKKDNTKDVIIDDGVNELHINTPEPTPYLGKFTVPDTASQIYNMNLDWQFKKADAFPLDQALEKHKDTNGKYFYEEDYLVTDWLDVSLPHTFNDSDSFSTRIRDAGSSPDRTFSFYRKSFTIPEEHTGKKVIVEFEGIRQTAFVYINGEMVGYYEAGVAPFAFDLTPYIRYGRANLIAVATDNTSARGMTDSAAETPNKADVEPGYYVNPLSSSSILPEERKGIGYVWNTNDFNPTYGGITRNVRLHIKNEVYQTLPIYSNLMTKGVYVYGTAFDIKGKSAVINVEAEVRNESDSDCTGILEIALVNHAGELVARFSSQEVTITKANLPEKPPLSITPEDAYVFDDNLNKYVPVEDEDKVLPTRTASLETTVIKASAKVEGLRFWTTYDPYLYNVYSMLKLDGEIVDISEINTGFRKVSYDNGQGLLINDEPVWLTGYAQRATNEWAAIGVAPDWLKDYDAQLIKESNGNFIRWMHVAASPADIRACDQYGIVCVQPAGDKEKEATGRQWDQRVEVMRDVILYFRNSPSIIFWEAGNNAISKEHMREMTQLKQKLDPSGGRYMGCRSISEEDVVAEAEFVGTMLNRHVKSFHSDLMPVVETEYLREEAPRRVWDDYSPPDYDYDNLWLGSKGKQDGGDVYDLTSEDFAVETAKYYHGFFNNRVGGASGLNYYSAIAALCWTDSAQHGRQAASENARMSGRVDPVRIKKQSFYVFQTLQDTDPNIMIVGHWNYPQMGEDNYKYALKEWDGNHWVKTGESDYRDPKNKTVYVIGNTFIDKVELYINDKLVDVCDKAEYSFIYPFEGIDITQSGSISAKAYDKEGNLVAEDIIETVGEPVEIRLTPVTGSQGLIADGADIMFIDVEVVDSQGRVCPLNYDRIDFTVTGEGVFLGGYNSGRFNGHGREDSVIHQTYVYAECGSNRVFVKSTRNAGDITVTATMEGLPEARITISSVAMKEEEAVGLSLAWPQRLVYQYSITPPALSPYRALQGNSVNSIDQQEQTYYDLIVNNKIVDLKGEKAYQQTGVFGPIIPVLDAIKAVDSRILNYNYNADKKQLTMTSGKNTIIATVGESHLIVNGEENLMNGEPELHDKGSLCMEINTIISFIENVNGILDEDAKTYIIEVKK